MNPEPLFVGVDLGTSSLKCGLFDVNGQRLRAAKLPYPTHYSPGGAEQHSEAWWESLAEGIARITSGVNPTAIAALAVGGHAPSPVFVDTDFQPVSPVLTWLDNRSAPHADQIIAALGRRPANGPERLLVQTAARAWWLRDTAPDRFAPVDCILNSGDYLASRLTGQRLVTSPIVPEILQAAQLPLRMFPVIVLQPGNLAGVMQADAAQQLNLTTEVPVVAAGLDSFLASLGSGICELGDACLSTGSAAGAALLAPATCNGRFPWCDYQLLSQPIRLGGRLLELILEITPPAVELSDLLQAAGQLRHPLRAHRVLEELIEESNIDDWFIRAVISQLAQRHDAAEILRLLLDAIFLVQRRVLDELATQGGPIRRLRSVGALASYPQVNQLQADILGRTIEVPPITASGTLGAAMLAAVAMGYGTQLAAAERMVRSVQAYHPRDEVTNYYQPWVNSTAPQQNPGRLIPS